MQNSLTKTSIAIFSTLICATFAPALEVSEVETFFQGYQDLADAFDPEIASLYSDAAEVRTIDVYADGDTVTTTMSGVELKSTIAQAMRTAEAAGDRSLYSSIKISVEGNRAVIEANRFAVLQQYNDVTYKMVVEEAADGRLQIIEEQKRIYQ